MVVNTPVDTAASGGRANELFENCAEIHGLKGPEKQQDANGEAEVADARGDECFFAGADRGLLQEPESDEQVAAEAHAFPADEHQDDVGGEDQREHEEDKEIQIAEEAVVALFVRHVSGGINVHEQADEGDDAEHDDGELVHLQREIHFELACGDPGEVRLHHWDLFRGKLREFAD